MSYTAIYARNIYSELCQSKEGYYFARFESYYNGHKSWSKWLPVRSFERNELGHVVAKISDKDVFVYTVIEEKEVNYRLPKNGGLVDTLPDYYPKDGLIMIEDKYCEEYGAYEVAHVGHKGVRYSLSNRYQTKICYRYKTPQELVDMVLKANGIISNCRQDGGGDVMSYTALYACNKYDETSQMRQWPLFARSELCQNKQGFFFARVERCFDRVRNDKTWGAWLPVIAIERDSDGHIIAKINDKDSLVFSSIEKRTANYLMPRVGGIVNAIPEC